MTKRPKFLVADDDAWWASELSKDERANFVFVDNLSQAMKLIDRRRKWDGAIFDRFLLDGPVPFAPGELVPLAGFMLSVAFLDRFPDKRVCIVSSAPETEHTPEHLRRVFDSGWAEYFWKGSGQAAELSVDFLLSGKRPKISLESILSTLLLEPNFFGLGINLAEVIRRVRRGRSH